MPTYEYLREDGSVFDFLQGINDAPLEVCPTTGLKVRRIISGGAGVIYKGDGWYVTDYKNKNGGAVKNNSDNDHGHGKGAASSKESGMDNGKANGGNKSAEGGKPGDSPAGSDS